MLLHPYNSPLRFWKQGWPGWHLLNGQAFFFLHQICWIFYFLRFYLFICRERGKEGQREGEKHQSVGAFHTLLLGTSPATQACTLTGNRTGNPLVRRLVLNPLSHTSQDAGSFFFTTPYCFPTKVYFVEYGFCLEIVLGKILKTFYTSLGGGIHWSYWRSDSNLIHLNWILDEIH